uniref:Ig-like domain-containing protein n=1 Tax=Monopterus albus TaxID=43700 RepID=A0A3Q3JD41_MONAL|nr:CMRF35-like molecule 8 isoform X1 [Monopterus albus]
MPQLLILTLNLLSWIPVFLCRVTTVEEFAVLEGRSLTVPCHYEPQYASYVKYWCSGRMRSFCSILAQTDATLVEDKVSILDDPVQLVFTVTMNDLKVEDSGWYMCGVEIEGIWHADDIAYTYIKVIHGMSIVNSQLTGEEGSSVTAECLYSERYREKKKKWCRSGDWSSCLQTDSEGNYEDTSVAISDDRTGKFTVTLKKLQMRDTGWYLCSTEQAREAVHVLVTPQPTTTAPSVTSPFTSGQAVAHLAPPKPIIKQNVDSHRHILMSLTVCSIMLLVGSAIWARKMWNVHRPYPVQRHDKEARAPLSEQSVDVGDLQNVAGIFRNKDYHNVHIY